MNVLVDTSVWSHALRRAHPAQSAVHGELAELIREGRVRIIGPIRQELLSGIKDAHAHRRLRDHLRAFPDLALDTADFEDAAVCFNHCRARGVQGSNTDFLICAVARRRGLEIFTTDADFEAYGNVLSLKLHSARRAANGG